MFRPTDRVSPVRAFGTPDPESHRDKPPAMSTTFPAALSRLGLYSALACSTVPNCHSCSQRRDPRRSAACVFDPPDHACGRRKTRRGVWHRPSHFATKRPAPCRCLVLGPHRPAHCPYGLFRQPFVLVGLGTTSSVRRAPPTPVRSSPVVRPHRTHPRPTAGGPTDRGPPGLRRPGAPRATAPISRFGKRSRFDDEDGHVERHARSSLEQLLRGRGIPPSAFSPRGCRAGGPHAAGSGRRAGVGGSSRPPSPGPTSSALAAHRCQVTGVRPRPAGVWRAPRRPRAEGPAAPHPFLTGRPRPGAPSSAMPCESADVVTPTDSSASSKRRRDAGRDQLRDLLLPRRAGRGGSTSTARRVVQRS